LDSETQIIQKIILSIVKGNSNVTEIRFDTGLHRKTLSKYLPILSDRKLIELKTKDWKRGKSMFYDVTANGINWLVNNPLNETLEFLTEVIDQLSIPKFREIFKKAVNEHDLNNTKIIRNYFVERLIRGDKTFNPPEFDKTDFDQPFREALKKIFTLHLYLISTPDQTPEEINNWIEKRSILFWPNMRYAFSWDKGAFPKLEQAINETEDYYLEEDRKLGVRDKKGDTHLLGLDFVDEEYFDKYLKADSISQRRKAMAKIEDEAGWTVHLYMHDLFHGQQKEIDSYIDRSKRPNLYKFISLFYDQKGFSKYPKSPL
jgi:hypothetical protein